MAARRLKIVADAAPVRFFSSGCALLDCVLGGGWAMRRMINVVGDKSTGKTLLAIEACANFVRTFPSGRVTYDEVESAFDVDYAQTLGFPEHNLDLVDDIRTVEAFWEQIKKLIDAATKHRKEEGTEPPPQLVVIDSMDAFSDAGEMERDIGDASYGMAKAKVMSEGFRKFTGEISAANITIFIISQVRDNINAVGFGAKKVKRAGGKWLDFYASQCLWLYEQQKIEKTIAATKRKIGMEVMCRLEKSKVGWPWRDCIVPVIYGYGMDDRRAALDYLSVNAPEAIPKLFEGVVDKPVDKGNYMRYIDKLPRTHVTPIITEEYERIDRQFRPTTQKYTE
jgi:RecA/RadA recombinase